jgi:4-alpha-glucanotransferase
VNVTPKNRSPAPPERSSGVQLHITSLPSGTLGADAHRFVDWLAEAGQSWWQMLPLGPPDRYGSPYKARSAFAAWPGLLGERRAPVTAAEISAFREREAFWIDDWERFAGSGAIADQVRFDREWRALREYATERGVRLYGDVPIYIAAGSADHRAHPALFRTGVQAGAPPDAYSASGQLWGNPLYDWPRLQHSGYRWWVERLRRTLAVFDLARLDHFRGFVALWEVQAGARTAAHGRWRRGPGRALFDAAERELGSRSSAEHGTTLRLVAEDLGVITPAVERLRDQLALPGMLVLQFGFDPEEPASPHRFANHVQNRVVYTGTHDTDTARGWYESLPSDQRADVNALLRTQGIAEREPWWGLIALALRSPARVAMTQMQDVLGLGSEGRMNAPGSASGNWRWRLERMPPQAAARRLCELTAAAGRLPAQP